MNRLLVQRNRQLQSRSNCRKCIQDNKLGIHRLPDERDFLNYLFLCGQFSQCLVTVNGFGNQTLNGIVYLFGLKKANFEKVPLNGSRRKSIRSSQRNPCDILITCSRARFGTSARQFVFRIAVSTYPEILCVFFHILLIFGYLRKKGDS